MCSTPYSFSVSSITGCTRLRVKLSFFPIYISPALRWGGLSGVQLKSNDLICFLIYFFLVTIFNLFLAKQCFAEISRQKRQKRGILALINLAVIIVLSIGGLLSPLIFNSAVNLGFPSHLIINI